MKTTNQGTRLCPWRSYSICGQKHNTSIRQKEPNNKQRLFYSNILHEEAENFVTTEEEFEAFNQVFFQTESEGTAQLEGEASVVHGANSDPTKDEPLTEALNMFISTQTE